MEINPHTLQVSLAAAYPGTFLYKQAQENGWLVTEGDQLTSHGIQVSSLSYPNLPHAEVFNMLDEFYKRFYLRPSKIIEITSEMMGSWEMTKRRLREGVEFFRFLAERKKAA
jgi:hypothetical protein